eukprot:gene23461-27940_t
MNVLAAETVDGRVEGIAAAGLGFAEHRVTVDRAEQCIAEAGLEHFGHVQAEAVGAVELVDHVVTQWRFFALKVRRQHT